MFVKLIVLTLVSLVAWTGFVHPSQATTAQEVYAVKPGDTLWTIAARNYAGDPREAVWRVKEENSLASAVVRPGQLLRLP
jgi:hypothetical protein